jgi:Leucine-rich repeat (LRR) protein
MADDHVAKLERFFLFYLYLENKLKDLQLLNFSALTQLEVRANQLVSTDCISQATLLKKAYLGANAIEAVKGIEGLVNLTHLHLRDNKIAQLNGFTEDQRSLSYINLRSNSVTEIEQLDKLACLPALESLVLTGIVHVD